MDWRKTSSKIQWSKSSVYSSVEANLEDADEKPSIQNPCMVKWWMKMRIRTSENSIDGGQPHRATGINPRASHGHPAFGLAARRNRTVGTAIKTSQAGTKARWIAIVNGTLMPERGFVLDRRC
ncbi:hypothetical protein XPA_010048 [Xanthoria parietina]